MIARAGCWIAVTCALLAACSPTSSGGSAGGSSSGTNGTNGSTDGGTSGTPGGTSGTPGGTAGDGPVLPEGTLLYQRFRRADNRHDDSLIARDLATGDERVVTDLTGDGSDGWDIWGYSLSPDRRRIALASLYGPTAEDNETGLATRRIWTLAVDGTDFRRLTPTFPNDSEGRSSYAHEIGSPEWSSDGSFVVFNWGTYWYEGTTLKGGSFPWTVSAAGDAPPSSFPTPTDCGQVIYPSRNPVTGDFLFVRQICIPGQGEGAGVYLYPATGSTTPTKIVGSAHVDGSIDVFSAKPAWFPDGSGFAFVGGLAETEWRPSLLAYDAQTGNVSLVVAAPEGYSVDSVTIAPDFSKAVYCLRHGADNTSNLHLLDLTATPPTDTAITTDGASYAPSF